MVNKLWPRVLDFVVYVGVGLLFALGVIWYVDHTRSRSDHLARWLGLVVHTAIIFGFSIQSHRGLRRVRSFWPTIGALLVLHLVVFTVLLQRLEYWRMLWFIFLYPAEFWAIDIALGTVVRQRPKGSQRHLGPE